MRFDCWFSNCLDKKDANLLLFKTVIAGDSWGTIAVPVIEAQPLTAVIFMGSLLSLVYGVVNLIVATGPQWTADLGELQKLHEVKHKMLMYSIVFAWFWIPVTITLQAVAVLVHHVFSCCMSFLGLGPLYGA